VSLTTRRTLYWTVALTVAGASLWLSLQHVSWSEVGEALSSADYSLLAVAALVSSVSLFLRAVRWRLLLSARSEIKTSTVFWAACAGYFGNSFLPARAGEVLRTLIVSKESGLSKAFVLTTALSERLLDAVFLAAVSALVLWTLPTHASWLVNAAKVFAIAGVAGMAVVVLLPRIQHVVLRFGFVSKMSGVISQMCEGVSTLHETSRLIRFGTLTVVIWFVDAIATVLGMRALGMHGSLPLAVLLITAFGLGSALPATPGYIGIYQFAAVSVLTPFGFAKADAIAYSFLVQAMQYLLFGFWGVLGIVCRRMLVPGSKILAANANDIHESLHEVSGVNL
jgi:hypothetical protein